jgi:hypothetical protein
MRTQTLCHRIEKKNNQKFVWLKVASINISRSTVSGNYYHVGFKKGQEAGLTLEGEVVTL